MIRLNITGEGLSEVRFANQVLKPLLALNTVYVSSRAVYTSYDKKLNKTYRGGFIGSSKYEKAKRDIIDWMKQDKSAECRFTTMFDLYALPNDFPGYEHAKTLTDPYQKVEYLESELAKDINEQRFIPYIQLHEFETLLYADLSQLKTEYRQYNYAIDKLIQSLTGVNPETINESPMTAPSKRIISIIPEYDDDKATVGPILLEAIGLQALRASCRHFNEWVSALEKL